MNTPPKFEAPGFRFDKTITAGNLLTVLAGILTMSAAYMDYRITIDRHEQRLGLTEARVTELYTRSAAEAIARQEQIRAIDKLTTTLDARDRYQHPDAH